MNAAGPISGRFFTFSMTQYFYYIVAALFLFACSSDKPNLTGAKGGAGVRSDVSGTLQQPGVDKTYALEITPKEATRKSILKLSSTGFDLSRTKIEWQVNGRPFTTQVPTQFDGADAAKGVTVQAKAMMQDQEVASNNVQIMNCPPEISRIKLMPEVFKPGDTLSVDVQGEDIDGDAISFLYEWTKNGETAGKGNRIGMPVKRGDNISVRVIPYDGTDYGNPIVLNREIRNLPPMIVEHQDFSFDDTTYTYQVKATDPDGDKLVYALESPPDGITIDPSTGLLKWVVPKEFKGKKDVLITVSDGNGGTAKYSLTISIR
jgi:hypothetical protein